MVSRKGRQERKDIQKQNPFMKTLPLGVLYARFPFFFLIS